MLLESNEVEFYIYELSDGIYLIRAPDDKSNVFAPGKFVKFVK